MSDQGRDRLDPAVLAEDAANLLASAGADGVHGLIVSLLKTVRTNDDRENAIRDGYLADCKVAWDRAEAAEQERNEYREALRLVKRATRNVRVGRW